MWAKKYNKCVVCGTVEVKHQAKGMCSNCYEKNRCKINIKKECPWCKISFNPKRLNQTYCNKQCWRKSLSNSMRGKNNKMFGIHLKASRETKEKMSKVMRGKNNPMFGISLVVSEATKIKKLKSWTKEKRQKHSEKFIGENNIFFKGGEKISRKKRIEKIRNTPHLKLKSNVSGIIHHRLRRRSLSKNGKSTFDFLPYTVDELKIHLESLFETWMNWDNWGRGKGCWNIDHKKPDSSFDYKSVEDEEFQKCWALSNLQPMDAIENIKKGNKLINETYKKY